MNETTSIIKAFFVFTEGVFNSMRPQNIIENVLVIFLEGILDRITFQHPLKTYPSLKSRNKFPFKDTFKFTHYLNTLNIFSSNIKLVFT